MHPECGLQRQKNVYLSIARLFTFVLLSFFMIPLCGSVIPKQMGSPYPPTRLKNIRGLND